MISVEAAYEAVRRLRSPDVRVRQEARELIEVWLDERVEVAFVKEMTAVFSEPSADSRKQPSPAAQRKGRP